MIDGRGIISLVAERQDLDQFRRKHWEGGFDDYLELVRSNSGVARNAFERVYDMILSYGTETYEQHREKRVRYRFFDDPGHHGEDAVFGLDEPLAALVNAFKSAAKGYGIEKRVLLLHGPVGSSKSTIARLLKHGLERYSASDEGALYTIGWTDLGDRNLVHWCPMHEEPLHMIPSRFRPDIMAHLNEGRDPEGHLVKIVGELCPFCRYIYHERLRHYDGDWTKVVEDVRVKRLLLSEKDRIGIGTFQPKDEKNQDSTELTGDINYRKIAEYGSDSDPRAFNFDGEFNVANRGIIEFVEVLKLDVAFLYDLLGASQEHKVKPKKFAQTDIDEVILGHTNEPEYRRLQNNEFMEALRDRTVKIDVPYVTRLSDEIKIYEKDYNRNTVKGKHIAPHTIEMAAMWAILTRLEEPKNAGLTLLQKLKLYNGKSLPGFTEENIKELKEQTTNEGMLGISPRYVQDKISNALVAHPDAKSINPFMVLNELENGLRHHTLITSDEQRVKYRELLGVVKEEYENIVKNEVQRAIAADEDALKRLCGNYIDNVKAYTQREKVKNPFTGQYQEPDERLMRSVEQKIDIPDSRKDDFRR
jgi:serine protein kinase